MSLVLFRLSDEVVSISAPPKAGSFTGGLPPPKITTARPAARIVFAGKANRLLVASATITPEISTAALELFSSSTNSSSSPSRTRSRFESPARSVEELPGGSARISLITSGTCTFSVAFPEMFPPRPSAVVAVMVVVPMATPVARPRLELIVATAVLVAVQVKVALGTGWLFVSKAIALNCCWLPRLIVGFVGVTSTREICIGVGVGDGVGVGVGVGVGDPPGVGVLERFCGSLGLINAKSFALLFVSCVLPVEPPGLRS